MTSDRGLRPGNSQEISTLLNETQVAFNSGDFILAKRSGNTLLSYQDLDANSYDQCHLIFLQIRERQGDLQGLLAELEKLFSANPLLDPDIQAKVGNEILRVCHRSENFEAGVAHGEKFLRVFQDHWPEAEVVELHCQLAACHFFRGDSETAMSIARKALAMAQKTATPKSMASHSGNSLHFQLI